jgi:hypothetical protein
MDTKIEYRIVAKIYNVCALSMSAKLSTFLSHHLETKQIIMMCIIAVTFINALSVTYRRQHQSNNNSKSKTKTTFSQFTRMLESLAILICSRQLLIIFSYENNERAYMNNIALALTTAIGLHCVNRVSANVLSCIMYMYSDVFSFAIPIMGPFPALVTSLLVTKGSEWLLAKNNTSFITIFMLQLLQIAAQNTSFLAIDQLSTQTRPDLQIFEGMIQVMILQKLSNPEYYDYFAYIGAIKIIQISHSLFWVSLLITLVLKNSDHWLLLVSLNYTLLCVASWIKVVDIVVIPCIMVLFFYLEQVVN